MDFLRFLQSLRNPVCDTLVAAVTYLGDEIFFMVAGMVMLWCVNKKWGYRFMIAGLAGTTLNQLLKAIFLIPRPWVLDPTFAIVEAARAAATGYSFPSGHTQSAALVFGMLAMWAHKKWVTVLAVVMTLLVGFSRVYVGAHYPTDVIAGWILDPESRQLGLKPMAKALLGIRMTEIETLIGCLDRLQSNMEKAKEEI